MLYSLNDRTKNVLSLVTEKIKKNLEHHFCNMTAASMTDNEEAEIEADLGTGVAIYLFYNTSNKCNKCDCGLNAYGFYFSGKNVHDDSLKANILDAPYKVQVRGINARAAIVCCNRRSLNVFPTISETGGEDNGYYY